jgi:hypothetical protein
LLDFPPYFAIVAREGGIKSRAYPHRFDTPHNSFAGSRASHMS